jgi:hypothetical protein
MTTPSPRQTTQQAAVLAESYLALRKCLLDNHFTSYDIFDGLNSRVTRFLALNKQFLRQSMIQAIKRAPVNVRPLFGVRPSCNVKTLADFVSAELLRASSGHFATDYDEQAIRGAIARILGNRCPGYAGSAWGLPFPYATRSGWMREGTPNIIMTWYCANALLDYHEHCGDHVSLGAAVSVADFILNDLGYVESEDGTLCFNYIPEQVYSIHNANMLAASLLARIARYTGDERSLALALRGAQYTAKRQQANGAWYYGEKPNLHWIDGFHTGYILDSLSAIASYTGESLLGEAMTKGVAYLIDNFVLPDGRVKYYHNNLYPVDMQNIAQVCQTLCILRESDPRAEGNAVQIAQWAIGHLQDTRGFFHPMQTRFRTVRVPFHRWSDGPMLVALAHCLSLPSCTVKERE